MPTEEVDGTSTEQGIPAPSTGAFDATLLRNNKQIKHDRGAAISRGARMKYKRRIEDIEEEMISMDVDRDNMLDLSPTNSTSLVLASEFNTDEYQKKDLELTLRIRNKRIELNEAKKRFNHLFGYTYEIVGGLL